MCIAAFFVVAKTGKNSHVLQCEWLNKLMCIRTMEDYSAVRRNKLFLHVITWINRKKIMLSQNSIPKSYIRYSYILCSILDTTEV